MGILFGMLIYRLRQRIEVATIFLTISLLFFLSLTMLVGPRPRRAHSSGIFAQKRVPELDRTDPLEVYVIHALLKGYDRKAAFDLAMRVRMLRLVRPGSSMHDYFMKVHFGWLRGIRRPEDLLRTWDEPRGIVICTGNEYFRLSVHLIRVLRYHGCRLPIEIMHMGPDDLRPSRQAYLARMSRVRTVDLRGVFAGLHLNGWDMKPFALLASRFRQVLLLDADVVFLQSPEQLFQDHDFLGTGALFFRDRTLHRFDNVDDFVNPVFPWPHSRTLDTNGMSRRVTRHLQESGLVLLDKPRHLYGLLMVCLLNMSYQRQKGTIKDYVHGDKETFWMGLELLEEDYAFMPFSPGSIGVPRQKPENVTAEDPDKDLTICGKLLHFDRRGRPFWFNDSILREKHTESYEEAFYPFQYYAVEGSWSSFLCLDSPLQPLPPGLLRTIEDIKQLYLPGPDRHLRNALASLAMPFHWLVGRVGGKALPWDSTPDQ